MRRHYCDEATGMDEHRDPHDELRAGFVRRVDKSPDTVFFH